MKISFDLDDVLFVSPEKYETEPALRFPYNLLFKDRLRKGTVKLIHELQKRGFEVWVYTSSFRQERYIRSLFQRYGVHIDQVVNGQRHEEEVQRGRKTRLPQKMPNFYHISLHIDDEKVVQENARHYGYRVMRVYEPDENWVEKVLREADRVFKLEQAAHR